MNHMTRWFIKCVFSHLSKKDFLASRRFCSLDGIYKMKFQQRNYAYPEHFRTVMLQLYAQNMQIHPPFYNLKLTHVNYSYYSPLPLILSYPRSLLSPPHTHTCTHLCFSSFSLSSSMAVLWCLRRRSSSSLRVMQ